MDFILGKSKDILGIDKRKKVKDPEIDKLKIKLMIPEEDVDLKAYRQLLDMAFKTHEANNIAITGIHGAGKSSILNTYQKENPDKKIIFISLANLTGSSGKRNITAVKSSENQNDTQEIKRRLLEDRIYKQLKYHSNRTWKSEARRKLCWKLVLGFLSAIWMLSLVYLLKFQKWQLLYGSLKNRFDFFEITVKSEFFMVILLGWLLLSLVLWMIGISKIKSISLELKGGKITWENKEDILLGLRERTDEIVQMIHRLGVHGIVFEDLDRYPDMIAPVIENLLDINRLVNTCNYNKMERYLHCYAKKILKSCSQCFIIAIVFAMMLAELALVVYGYRSFGLMISVVIGIALCMVDGIIYYEYKKSNRHVLFFYVCSNEMLRNEDTIKYFHMQIPVVPVLSRINAEKILKEQLRDALELSDADKLATILSKYLDNYNQIKDIIMNFYIYYHRLGESGQDELGLDKAKMIAIITYKAFFPKDFSEVQRGNDRGYLDYVFKKYSGSGIDPIPVKRLRERILKNELDGKTVPEIRKMLTKDAPRYFHTLKRNPNFNLIIELIKAGFLDEAYEDYIAYIYGGDDEIRERRFIEALSKEGKAYEYKLKKPESVCQELGEVFFGKISILNYSLLEYLLLMIDEEQYSQRLGKMLQLIIDNNVIDFFCGFCSIAEDLVLHRFWEELNRLDSDFISTVPASIGQQPYHQGIKMINQISAYAVELSGVAIGFDKAMRNLISSDRYRAYFMSQIESEEEQIISICTMMDVKFRGLYLENDFCIRIYENCLFAFSEEAMEDIFHYIFGYDKHTVPWPVLTEKIYESLEVECGILKKYIEKNPEDYLIFLTEFYKKTNKQIKDGKAAVNWLTKVFHDSDTADKVEQIQREILLNDYLRMVSNKEQR